MTKLPSLRRQTLRLVSTTLGLCLITALIAAAPTTGADKLWNGAIQTIGEIFSGSFSTSKATGPRSSISAKERQTNRKGDFPGGEKDVESPLSQSGFDESLKSNPKEEACDDLLGSRTRSGPTPSPSLIETVTPTSREHSTPTAIETTHTPTPQATVTPTIEASPTPTPTVMGRRLALGSIEVSPGDSFVVVLSCNDLMGVAGCDFEIMFPPELVDLIKVQKTEFSDSFLMISKKWASSYSISMAALGGLPSGEGDLLLFEGISSVSQTEVTTAPLQFSRAKMYDETSRAIPVSTQDGLVTIKTNEEADPSPFAEEVSDMTPLPEPTYESGPESDDPAPQIGGADPTPVGGDSDTGEILPIQPLIPPVVVVISPSETATPSPTPTSLEEHPAEDIIQAALQTDLTKDGVVDYRDLFEFLKYWKQSMGTE